MKIISSIDKMVTGGYYMLYGRRHSFNGESGKCVSVCRKLEKSYDQMYDSTTSKIVDGDSLGRNPRRCRLLEDFLDTETQEAFIHIRYELDSIFELDEVEIIMLEDAFLL